MVHQVPQVLLLRRKLQGRECSEKGTTQPRTVHAPTCQESLLQKIRGLRSIYVEINFRSPFSMMRAMWLVRPNPPRSLAEQLARDATMRSGGVQLRQGSRHCCPGSEASLCASLWRTRCTKPRGDTTSPSRRRAYRCHSLRVALRRDSRGWCSPSSSTCLSGRKTQRMCWR